MIFAEPFQAIIIALALTLIIEIPTAFVLGFRKKEELLAVVGVNLVTNPPLNFFIQLNSQIKLIPLSFSLIILLEAIVVIIEFLLFSLVLKRGKKKLFLLALAMNTASFLFGLLIQLA
jgi:predicted neutral ceramidase superfamily lipid hydrolase